MVQVDAANNAPGQKMLNIDLGVAPVYPREFVAIRVQKPTLDSE